MKHAMFLPYDTPGKMIEWAQKLEQTGFDSAWQGELTNSALLPLAAVAPSVKHIDRVRAKVNERAGLLDTISVAVPNTGTTAEQRDYYRNKLVDAFSA